ncbi:bifunctional lysylphosphatidylglycerol synthetase/lysine--tRNA ligase LysX [Actinomyces sp. zg-332]|uniref:bifunctional lysylphosphatidylglycerol synthetase/lysine--tRNA ligase LysX n=1 Tax=Actinomyces sp. zg-332 TaxID=2708340 RepID=UPI00141DCC68|nr:bifunctional lysylphosphatidylglycerol synthetase/lysine--tRNA ligase LysX [Actinomyces sp. zg-332]QPK93982.1 bifunctional lysylphosphatidylglycerol synthetase/lysine--tRNA ligase LysX [Actinomyces sp. zg-332]
MDSKEKVKIPKTFLLKVRECVPSIIGWVSILAGFWSVLDLLSIEEKIPFINFIEDNIFALFNLIQGPSLFMAVLMFIYAGAAFRHKRLTIWLFMLIQIIVLLGYVVLFISDGSLESDKAGYWYIANFVITVLMLIMVIWARKEFPSKINIRAALIGVTILVVGETLLISISILVHALYAGNFTHLSGICRTVVQSALGIGEVTLDSNGIVLYTSSVDHVVSLLSTFVMAIAFRAFLLSSPYASRSVQDDYNLHNLLSSYETDSLAYFSTGTNRAAVFSTNKDAVVTYGVSYGVALAGGDPIGNPSAWEDAIKNWVRYTREQGLVPAVISVTEKGARAYKKAGFTVRSMGDEAIIDIQFFDPNTITLRGVLAAKRRVLRSGVNIQCRRLSAISEEEIEVIRQKINEYRTGDERGFSMSLDRLLSTFDYNQMIVTAYNTEGELEGVLTFVPWGVKGLSLNLMRRNPNSINGVIEAMVLTLIDHCKDENIDKVSLNFAMLRNVFVEGTAVNATIIKRLMRKLMLIASKFWQLESLYESNAKYNPVWQTRYLAFKSGSLTSALIAMGQLEGFVPTFGRVKTYIPEWIKDPFYMQKIKDLYANNLKISFEGSKLGDQQKIRHQKANALSQAGMDPYPPANTDIVTTDISEVVYSSAKYIDEMITVNARISARRHHGKLVFIDLFDGAYKLQALASVDVTDKYGLLKLTDIGDIVSLTGKLGYSNTNELTLFITKWTMLAKTLRPIVTNRHKIDKSTATRNRTMQFINQSRSVELLRMRSKAISSVREYLYTSGYLEVETPMLHVVKGGANARPFVTHMNAYNYQVTLRIAPELYLKRLIVGGMKAIFEIGRSFRNEGVDATHNPEFTSLEAYKIGADYNVMRELTEKLIRQASISVHGSEVVWQPKETVERFIANPLPNAPELKCVETLRTELGKTDSDGKQSHEAYLNVFDSADEKLVQVDLSKPWPVVPVLEAVSNVVGKNITMDTSTYELLEISAKFGLKIPEDSSVAYIINELYEELVEPNTGYPTFYIDFPAEACPLTRKHRVDERLAERWDLVAFGMEIGTAYTELSDPRDQRERFVQQSLEAAAGDPEAMSLDEDFLDSLELGFMPTGGMGMGMDRMVMLLCGTNIRDIIAFPFVKPNN